jgi:hypothetical protein
MTQKLIATALAATMFVGLVPATTRASDETTVTTPSVTAALDRAATRAALESKAAVQPAKPFKTSHSQEAQGGSGGGGGHMTAIIMTLVGTAASLGATYYIYKEMKKQTDQAIK